QAEYRAMIDEVLLYLDGRTDEVTRRVRERMEEASARLDFERAAELRNALRHLEQLEEPTVVVEVEGGDRDVIGYARDGDEACVVVLRIRAGKLLAREQLAPFEFDDRELIEQSLSRTAIRVPQRGPRRQLIDLAEQNARHLLEEQ